MHINQANIYNLTQLWKKYGSAKVKLNTRSNKEDAPSVYINDGWPHRCWHEGETPINDPAWLTQLPETTILPVWPILDVNENSKISVKQNQLEQNLINLNWQCQLEQTAMYLSLENDCALDKTLQPKINFVVKRIYNNEEIKHWSDIASKAFGYEIESSVIENLTNDKDIQIILAYYNDHPVATGLLYKTDSVIGVHQVGVPPEFQGRGFARLLMKELIGLCRTYKASHIVLQASKSGKPLYEKLGFSEQFLIRSYKNS